MLQSLVHDFIGFCFFLLFLYSSSQIWDVKGFFFHMFADADSERRDEMHEDFFSRQSPVVQSASLRRVWRDAPALSPCCSDVICGAGARACAASPEIHSLIPLPSLPSACFPLDGIAGEREFTWKSGVPVYATGPN